MEDYYALLNIPQNTTHDEIKNAYRAKIKQYHPDLYSTKSIVEQLEAEKMTKMINKAYEILSDQIKKNRYDNTLNNYRNKSYPHNNQKQKTSKSNYTSKKDGYQYQNNSEQNKENKKNDIEDDFVSYCDNVEKKLNNPAFIIDNELFYSLYFRIMEIEKYLPIIRRSHISLDDELLRIIAKTKPKTKDELKLIKGITDDDINRHGDTIINGILSFISSNDKFFPLYRSMID
jgi:curved DNA-binding protein CbpA